MSKNELVARVQGKGEKMTEGKVVVAKGRP